MFETYSCQCRESPYPTGRGSDSRLHLQQLCALLANTYQRYSAAMGEWCENQAEVARDREQAKWNHKRKTPKFQIGPEKGVIHLATAGLVNALWDLWGKLEGKPVWKLLSDMVRLRKETSTWRPQYLQKYYGIYGSKWKEIQSWRPSHIWWGRERGYAPRDRKTLEDIEASVGQCGRKSSLENLPIYGKVENKVIHVVTMRTHCGICGQSGRKSSLKGPLRHDAIKKEIIHLATGWLVNAMWDLRGKGEGKSALKGLSGMVRALAMTMSKTVSNSQSLKQR